MEKEKNSSRSLIYGSGLIFINLIVLAAVGFIRTKLFAINFSHDIFTVVAQLNSLIVIIGYIGNGFSDGARVVLTSGKTSEESKDRAQSWMLVASFLISLLIVLVLLPFSGFISEMLTTSGQYTAPVKYSLLAVPFYILYFLSSAIAVARNQYVPLITSTIFFALLSIVYNYVSISSKNFDWASTAFLVPVLIGAIANLFIIPCFRRNVFTKPQMSVENRQFIVRITSLVFLTTLSTMAVETALRTYIIHQVGLAQVSFYVLAFSLNTITMNLTNSVVHNIIKRIPDDANDDAFVSFYERAYLYIALLFWVIVAGVCAFAPLIVLLFSSRAYLPTALPFVVFIMAGEVLRTMYQLTAVYFQKKRKVYRPVSIIAIGLSVQVVFVLLLHSELNALVLSVGYMALYLTTALVSTILLSRQGINIYRTFITSTIFCIVLVMLIPFARWGDWISFPYMLLAVAVVVVVGVRRGKELKGLFKAAAS